jgi:glycolate oxidase FAD binding subunit
MSSAQVHEELFLDDAGPFPVHAVSQATELAELVQHAAQVGEAVFPIGGRTMLRYGLPPTRSGRAVDLRGLNRVLDYPAADMTITVQAGITLAELQRTLRANRQWLPLDVPFAEQATVGGTLACNLPGWRKAGYGSWRDYVLGMTVINDQGEAVRSGGRVVKNVAGYDLHKLHIGALGTLGIITEVTFKVRPLPESRALVLCRVGQEGLAGFLERCQQSRTRPVGVAVLNARAADHFELLRSWAEPQAYLALVGFEEKTTTVRWQTQHWQNELADLPGVAVLTVWDDPELPLWQQLADFPLFPSAQATFRAQVLPSQVAALLRAAQHLGPPALLAHATSGTVYGHWSEMPDAATLARHLEALRATAAGFYQASPESAPSPGRVVLLRCPSAWKTPELVWGQPSADAFLQRRIKETFDPKYLFNPGRFPTGW